MPEPDAITIAAWARLLRVSRMLLERVEADLKQAGLPPLVWYDALHEIAEAGDAGLRPYEVIERMLLAQYNASRLLARLEKQGLVERDKCPADGRGQIVRISAQGRELRRRMWAVYGPAIAERFGDHLTSWDVRELDRMLIRLAEGQTD